MQFGGKEGPRSDIVEDWRQKTATTPWKINGWNLQITKSPMFLKEGWSEPSTSMIVHVPAVHLGAGCFNTPTCALITSADGCKKLVFHLNGVESVDIHPRSLAVRPWKMVVGRLLSYWEGNFSWAMLNFGRVVGGGFIFFFFIPTGEMIQFDYYFFKNKWVETTN